MCAPSRHHLRFPAGNRKVVEDCVLRGILSILDPKLEYLLSICTGSESTLIFDAVNSQHETRCPSIRRYLRSPSIWLTEAQTAERLNLSKKWLQAQRLKGGGIRYAKFGSAVRYSLADIEEYEAKACGGIALMKSRASRNSAQVDDRSMPTSIPPNLLHPGLAPFTPAHRPSKLRRRSGGFDRHSDRIATE